MRYKLLIKLGADQKDGFSGCIEIHFSYYGDKDVYVDFQGNAVSNFNLNGESITSDIKFEKHKIWIPAEKLKSDNRLVFCFKNSYVTNSAGLHYYKDTDAKTYIFSHLEPFFCHRFFPCFDQPSIRGTLRLQVLSPRENW